MTKANKVKVAATQMSCSWEIEENITKAKKIIHGHVKYFAYQWNNVGNPPDWFSNPFNNRQLDINKKHWIDIDDFNTGIGDIKTIWELSRFSWLLVLTRAYLVMGDKKYLDLINVWLKNWVKNNPLNSGPNWKCGQETAIRIFHVLMSSYLLEQYKKPSEASVRFVFEHCQRIYPNIRYAIAQDNNHGISEAAALYISGNWFIKLNLLIYVLQILFDLSFEQSSTKINSIFFLICLQILFKQSFK